MNNQADVVKTPFEWFYYMPKSLRKDNAKSIGFVRWYVLSKLNKGVGQNDTKEFKHVKSSGLQCKAKIFSGLNRLCVSVWLSQEINHYSGLFLGICVRGYISKLPIYQAKGNSQRRSYW